METSLCIQSTVGHDREREGERPDPRKGFLIGGFHLCNTCPEIYSQALGCFRVATFE